MLYIWTQFTGALPGGGYKAKQICVSVYNPDSDNETEVYSAHNDCFIITVPDNEVGGENIVNNVLRAGGAEVKFIG